MDSISELESKVIKFRDDRDWAKFNNPKDLAISISLEAGELLEHFQWRNLEECDSYIKNHKEDLANEIADVMIYLLTISHDLNINLGDAVLQKLKINGEHYKTSESKGNYKKYTELANGVH